MESKTQFFNVMQEVLSNSRYLSLLARRLDGRLLWADVLLAFVESGAFAGFWMAGGHAKALGTVMLAACFVRLFLSRFGVARRVWMLESAAQNLAAMYDSARFEYIDPRNDARESGEWIDRARTLEADLRTACKAVDAFTHGLPKI